MKAAIYVRVSTDDQKTDLQRDELINYCKAKNLTFDIFEEKLSGTTRARPELEKLLDACKAKHYQKVIVFKIDRLSRSTKDFLNIFHELQQNQIELIAVKDSIDPSTPMGKAMMQILSVFAELECENIRVRVRAGMKAAKDRGKHVGRPPRDFDMNKFARLKESGLYIKDIAKEMGLSVPGLYKSLRRAVA